MSRTPGWMLLSQKAAEIAGLTVISRLLGPPRGRRKRPAFGPPPNVHVPAPLPPLPAFIAEVTDAEMHAHRAQMRGGAYLFVGFYSDGRVRMATTDGKRFSGIMVDQKAVMADLHEDDSFEMMVAVHAHAGDLVMLTMDGGPYDGQTLNGETL
ncbi:MAG: hypothetical protein M3N19_10150 [Candidatus Eremiobacteraeota bacterium]|nr:hypothetical protein [Candidatus Eremiobacteraeota bacterium]